MNVTKITEAVDCIRQRMPFAPDAGVVLGSGLGGLVAVLNDPVAIPYGEIPHFPRPTVAGHAGSLSFGMVGAARVAVLQGRAHLYEGNTADDVMRPVRVLARLGMRALVLTNAAGGINPAFAAGDIMVIDDHINLQGTNPLLGPNVEEFGPRFPDMTTVYDPALRTALGACASELHIRLRHGVYVGVLGPSYETPAEIRMFRAMGADAIGMSTVGEAIAARHMGVRIAGLSLITNMAAGVADAALAHEDVVACAQRANAAMTRLLHAFLAHVPSITSAE